MDNLPPDRTVPESYMPWPQPPRDGATGTTPMTQLWRAAPVPSASPPPRAPQPGARGRMPKAQALALAHSLKTGIAVVSLLSFGALAALAARHSVGVTARQGTTPASSSQSVNPSAPDTQSPAQGGGFFNQPTGGGYGIGSQNSGQPPASASAVS